MPASVTATPPAMIPTGTPPSVPRPSNARFDRLDSTDPALWWDRADPALWEDSTDAADIADRIDPAEANEPTLPIEANEAALPIDSTESWEQTESTEFSDHSDHMRGSVVPPQAGGLRAPRTRSGVSEVANRSCSVTRA